VDRTSGQLPQEADTEPCQERRDQGQEAPDYIIDDALLLGLICYFIRLDNHDHPHEPDQNSKQVPLQDLLFVHELSNKGNHQGTGELDAGGFGERGILERYSDDDVHQTASGDSESHQGTVFWLESKNVLFEYLGKHDAERNQEDEGVKHDFLRRSSKLELSHLNTLISKAIDDNSTQNHKISRDLLTDSQIGSRILIFSFFFDR
jgi:hypothetical protein